MPIIHVGPGRNVVRNVFATKDHPMTRGRPANAAATLAFSLRASKAQNAVCVLIGRVKLFTIFPRTFSNACDGAATQGGQSSFVRFAVHARTNSALPAPNGIRRRHGE